MLIILTAVTVAGWLALWAVLAARPSPAASSPAGEGPPQPAGTEPPAVVSLLAGRLESLGYPATLLDLAARGWFRLEAPAGGPVMCVPGTNRSGGELTAYERRAYAHVVNRAGDRLDVPAAALANGFAGAAATGHIAASDRSMKSAKDAFMEAFTNDVIADSRRRGLSRPRLSEPAGCLLWVAAIVPAIASGLAVHARHSHAYWIPVAGFFMLCAVTGIAVRGEKLTPAGREALRGWRARCTAAMATPAGLAGWPQREVAYAGALGRARSAVKLFSDTPGEPRGKVVWSSYGGYWRQITIGDPPPRGCLATGGVLLSILALVVLALLPATIATALLAHGELRAAAFGVMACDAVTAVRLLTKSAGIPTLAEFDGRVIEAWTEEESGENSTSTYPCLAIGDGVRDRAWVFSVTAEQYRRLPPGTLVHARVNPRRNRLLDVWPLAGDSR
jgi:hypothetical protein